MKAARSKCCKILKKKRLTSHCIVFERWHRLYGSRETRVRHRELSGNHRSVRGVRTLANFVCWLALKYILLLLTHFRKTGAIAIVTTSLTRSSHKNLHRIIIILNVSKQGLSSSVFCMRHFLLMSSYLRDFEDFPLLEPLPTPIGGCCYYYYYYYYYYYNYHQITIIVVIIIIIIIICITIIIIIIIIVFHMREPFHIFISFDGFLLWGYNGLNDWLFGWWSFHFKFMWWIGSHSNHRYPVWWLTLIPCVLQRPKYSLSRAFNMLSISSTINSDTIVTKTSEKCVSSWLFSIANCNSTKCSHSTSLWIILCLVIIYCYYNCAMLYLCDTNNYHTSYIYINSVQCTFDSTVLRASSRCLLYSLKVTNDEPWISTPFSLIV